MRHILLIGCGTIGRTVLRHVQGDARIRTRYLLERPHHLPALRQEFGSSIEVIASLDEITDAPDIAVECAGHEAVLTLVPTLLDKGIRTIIASVGALANKGVPERLERAAREGRTQVLLISGAIGGIDALSAARRLGLEAVCYTGRKPPRAWLGTPCEAHVNLLSLTEATTIFEGDARTAARSYPKNANVAAVVALAGLGMERTRVKLVADPHITGNVHALEARGPFGEMEIRLAARPSAGNPKTSALAAYSLIRSVLNEVEPVAL
jgi:aspartate dehydrogenase